MSSNINLQNKKIWVLIGTRPEAIKQIPLYFALCERFGKSAVALVSTGQHKELLAQVLDLFGVVVDHDMQIMTVDQTLTSSAANVLMGMNQLFLDLKKSQAGLPQWIIVQGDTTTAAMAAWAGFQHQIQIGHNEAGLRSYDLQNPFPEEANRKLISIVAAKHWAPTELAKKALLDEKVNPEKISVVGNTGIDALHLTLLKPSPMWIEELSADLNKKNLDLVLLTAHRRENQGEGIENWFKALREFIDREPRLFLVYPMHPNNAGREAVAKYFQGHPRIRILQAINYLETCHLLVRCRFVVTDSGGIQEEATTLGMPVVVCRKTTERMEAVQSGFAKLVGTDVQSVLQGMSWATQASENPKRPNSIFGDGKSSQRISAELFF